MLSLTVLAVLAGAPLEAGRMPAFVPSSVVRATGQATVRLLSARTVPMSAQSAVDAPQRRTTIRLTDGDHAAFIVEFE